MEALGSDSKMTQNSMSVRQQDRTADNGQDDYLNVDTYSWYECLQIIEDHEWSVERSVLRPSLPLNDTNVASYTQASTIDMVRHCVEQFLITNPATMEESVLPASSATEELHIVEASALLIGDAVCCDGNEPKRSLQSSPAGPKHDITSASTMSPIANTTSTTPNTSRNGTTPPRLQDALMEGRGKAPDLKTVPVTDQVTAEASHSLVFPEDLCAHLSPDMPFDADMYQRIGASQTPEVIASTFVTYYPPTPAMSVSELHLQSDKNNHEPHSTTEYEDTNDSHGEKLIETIVNAEVSPVIIDKHEADCEDSALDTCVPANPSFNAVDWQITPYTAKEDVVKSHLYKHSGQVSAVVQTAVVNPTTASSTLTVALPGPDNAQAPPVSPVLESQESGLSFIIESLATYSISTPNSTQEHKRSRLTTETDTDAKEQPVAKRKKIQLDNPTANQVGLEEVVSAESDGSETIKHNLCEGMVTEQDSIHSGQAIQQDLGTDAEPAVDGALASESVMESSKEPYATSVNDNDSQTQTVMLINEELVDEVADNPSKVSTEEPAEEPAETSRPQSLQGRVSLADSASLVKHFAGPYTQAPDLDLKERTATASISPLISPDPPVASPTTHCCARSTSKPLKPPTDPAEPGTSKAADQVEHQDHALEEHLVDAEETASRVEESEDLSKVDEEQMSLLLNAIRTPKEPGPRPTTPPIKQSSPELETPADNKSEPNESKSSATTNASTSPQPTPSPPRHEAETSYERRATRSETRSSDTLTTSSLPPIPCDIAAPLPPIKKEDPDRDPAPASPRQLSPRPTRSKPAAPVCAAPARKKSTRLARRKSSALASAPVEGKSAAKARKSASTTPAPAPAPTARKTRASSVANGSASAPPVVAAKKLNRAPAKDKTRSPGTAGAGASVLGKRRTRRGSAVEEVRREEDGGGGMKKRLRGRGEGE